MKWLQRFLEAVASEKGEFILGLLFQVLLSFAAMGWVYHRYGGAVLVDALAACILLKGVVCDGTMRRDKIREWNRRTP